MFFRSIRMAGVLLLVLSVCTWANAQSITINGSVDNNNPAAGERPELTLTITGTGSPQFNGFEVTIAKVGGGDLAPSISAAFLNASRVGGIDEEILEDGITDVRAFKSGDNYVVSLAPSQALTVGSTPITLQVRLTMADGWQPFAINLTNVLFGVGGDNPSVTKTVTGFPIAFGPSGPTPTFTATPTPTTPVVVDTPTFTPSPTPTTPPTVTAPGIFVLDDFGAVHTGGAANAVALTGGPYFGFQIARSLEAVFGPQATSAQGVGVMLLDGYGAVHTYSANRPTQSFYFWPEPGDVAADFAVFQTVSNGTAVGSIGDAGFWVVDRTGGFWGAGLAEAMTTPNPVSPALNGNTQRVVDITLADPTDGANGWVMDNMGNVYPFGTASNPNFPVSQQNDWVDLEIVGGQAVRMDSSGSLSWSGAPITGWDLPMVDGNMAVDFEVISGVGLIMIDRFGTVYTSGDATAPAVGEGPPYFGFEAVREMELMPVLPGKAD